MVRGLRPRNRISWAVDARRAHRGKRGCYRSSRTDAPNVARQSRTRGASGTPPLTGGRKTKASASWETDAQTPQTSAHPLGSPERGAVTALCAVTEGLRATWVRSGYLPTHPVGEGFHALPAWDEGLRGCARKKWCAGCARAPLARQGRGVQQNEKALSFCSGPFMEAPSGFEPENRGFAVPCLTTWLWRRRRCIAAGSNLAPAGVGQDFHLPQYAPLKTES